MPADIGRTLARRLRSIFGRRLTSANFAGQVITLDLSWRHERDYLDYIERGAVHGPLAMDVWTFSHFVRPGDVTLDAGANIGFTALLAKRAGAKEVHCFEPDPRIVDRLAAHAVGCGIVVHPVALGEKPGSLRLCLSAAHNQGSTASDVIVSKFPEVYGHARYVDVETATIDGIFGDKRFDLLKIDVEGSELATLKGAAVLLRSRPPATVYVEIYDELHAELHGLLAQHYHHAYRIVCDRAGRGRLYPLEADTTRLAREGLYIMPPSYIYSLASHEVLARDWTPPLVSSVPAGVRAGQGERA